MSDEVLIKCENVSKKFCRSLRRSLWYGVQDIGSELNPFRGERDIVGAEHFPELRKDEFWAVNDISFELKRGECLGLIGHNGAGKSTLLKILNGLIKPDHGRITMKGRIGAIIELNAGFNPILTGRENVYVYGSILGFSKKEINHKYDDIVEFAELADYMEMPFRSYSSGMKVRLGFSVAVQMEPDVLIIDEVLAVGDVGFKLKCLNAIAEVMKRSAVIFVSHTMPQISRVCSQVMLLENGLEVLSTGNVNYGISEYYKKFQTTGETIFDTGKAKVTDLHLYHQNEWLPLNNQTLNNGEDVQLQLSLFVDPAIESFAIKLLIQNQEMRVVTDIASEVSGPPFINTKDGKNSIIIRLPDLSLNVGKYGVCIVVLDDSSGERLLKHENIRYFNVYSTYLSWCDISPKSEWKAF